MNFIDLAHSFSFADQAGKLPIVLLVLYFIMSILALVWYGLDKRAARRHANRVPERTLLLLGLCGGWPGALLAQQLFRHKTKKPAFRWQFFFSVFLNLLLLALLLYWWIK